MKNFPIEKKSDVYELFKKAGFTTIKISEKEFFGETGKTVYFQVVAQK